MIPALKLLRPHHWVKNTLILLPAIAGGYLNSSETVLSLLLGLVSFSLVASLTYILNDYKDREHDRSHPVKKHRPLAAGTISIPQLRVVCSLLFLSIAATLIFLPPNFSITILVYTVLTVSYTTLFKRLPYIDILILASLYSIRVVAGITLSPAYPTFWLFAFSFSLFLCLSSLKRYTEVKDQHTAGIQRIPGRGYTVKDGGFLQLIGILAGILTFGTLMSYPFSPSVAEAYKHPKALMLIAIFVSAWLNKAWITAQRGRMHSDPLVYALRDPSSYLVVIASAIVLLFAKSGI